MLRADRWEAKIDYDTEHPGQSRVSAVVDASKIKVIEGHGGALPLTPIDRGQIHRAMRREVLRSRDYPEVRFVSSRITGYVPGRSDQTLSVSGRLTLVGITRSTTLRLKSTTRGRGTELVGEDKIVPSRWGIKQYTAFLGALKVKDEVGVSLRLSLLLRPAPRG